MQIITKAIIRFISNIFNGLLLGFLFKCGVPPRYKLEIRLMNADPILKSKSIHLETIILFERLFLDTFVYFMPPPFTNDRL